jgi:formate dehydrogenase subunit delta
MTMIDTGAKLARMANQIATFFRSYPEQEATDGIHDHIVSFWTPRMCQDLLAHADRDPTGLDPLVVAAVHAMGSGRSPTYKEAAGPGEVGEIGASDAG